MPTMADRPGDPARTAAQQAGDAAEDARRVATRAKPAGPSWPGTSMSVATSSTSWRSTRVPRRRSSSSRCAGGRAAASACPRRRSTTASAPASARRPTGCSTAGRCRTASAVPRLPLRFDLVVVEPEGAGSPPSPRHVGASRVGVPAIGRARPTSDRDPCYTPARSGASTPSHQLRPPAPQGAELTRGPFRPGRCRHGPHGPPVPGDEGPRRKEPTGGRPPCRPFRCGSCSRPESTSATRPAAGTPR